MNIIKTSRNKEFRDQLNISVMKELNLTNIMAVPRLVKVVVSAGCGKFFKDDKKVDFMIAQLKKITGQCPVKCSARKSIAGFSVREGFKTGMFVTLRRDMMYDFVRRLVLTAMPRIETFRGISKKKFDGHGNLNLGLQQQDIFLEADSDILFGLNIAFVTTAKTDDKAIVLFKKLDFPFI